jgi:hypothetical protein
MQWWQTGLDLLLCLQFFANCLGLSPAHTLSGRIISPTYNIIFFKRQDVFPNQCHKLCSEYLNPVCFSGVSGDYKLYPSLQRNFSFFSCGFFNNLYWQFLWSALPLVIFDVNRICTLHRTSFVVQWPRLTPCNGTYWVGFFPPLHLIMEMDCISEMWNVTHIKYTNIVFIYIVQYHDMQQSLATDRSFLDEPQQFTNEHTNSSQLNSTDWTFTNKLSSL